MTFGGIRWRRLGFGFPEISGPEDPVNEKHQKRQSFKPDELPTKKGSFFFVGVFFFPSLYLLRNTISVMKSEGFIGFPRFVLQNKGGVESFTK